MVKILPADARRLAEQSIHRTLPASDLLVLDAQTFTDLEIFEAESGAESLFDLCNLTRNKGGGRALRKRMRQPWSNPARIRETQAAINFIQAHREAFDILPSYVSTDSVDDYLYGSFPLVTSDNILEFIINLLELRFADMRNYGRIVRGVRTTAKMLRALKQMVHLPALAEPAGELGPLLAELRLHLERFNLDEIPDRELWEPGPWQALRTDQVFRLHEKDAMDRVLQLIYEVDALVAMADACLKFGFVMPQIDEGPLSVRAEHLVHPIVKDPVANAVHLDQDCRLLFLTGPNMAGKTTYLRAFALALYLGHLGMGVPAVGFRFSPAQMLFSSINLADDLRQGISFFRAEALRVKAIAEAVSGGHRVIALLDEPFKGTNVKDALDASRAVLERFSRRSDCLFMFSSHLIELGEQMEASGRIDCRHFEADESAGRLSFDYVLREGVSSQRLGMRVLAEEGIFDLLDENNPDPMVQGARETSA